jgi:hypothetical protein
MLSPQLKKKLKSWPVKRIEMFVEHPDDFEEDDVSCTLYTRPKKFKFICLACFREGAIRWVSGTTMLCQQHASENREWRKSVGLPPISEVGKEQSHEYQDLDGLESTEE